MNNIGVDLTEISRFAESLQNPRFRTRVFSEAEQSCLAGKNWNPASAAANFAAKEAFAKALGTGVRGFSLNEVSVLRNELGAPYFTFHGKAEKLVRQKGLTFSVSLTHDAGVACAVVTAQPRAQATLPSVSAERLLRLQKRFGSQLEEGALLEPSLICSLFPAREPDSHKGTYGKLTILAGCNNYRGAVALCTEAALRSGAGLVTLASVPPVIDAVSAKLYEPIFLPLPMNERGTCTPVSLPLLLKQAKQSTALLLGCGLGQNTDTAAVVETLLREAACPVVLDADGLNVLSGRIDILRTAKCRIVLTPHLGEMSRLCGKHVDEIKADPVNVAKAFAAETGTVVVLKDADTVVAAPAGEVFFNTTGNAGMARGGSGDVLAGMIAGFLAQGLPAEHAAACAVYLHGAAGDLAAQESSMLGMLPSDMLRVLPKLYHFAEE